MRGKQVDKVFIGKKGARVRHATNQVWRTFRERRPEQQAVFDLGTAGIGWGSKRHLRTTGQN